MTHGRLAADEAGAVDGTAFPRVVRDHGGFDPNKGGVTVGAGNGGGFIEIREKVFDANNSVITAGGSMKANRK